MTTPDTSAADAGQTPFADVILANATTHLLLGSAAGAVTPGPAAAQEPPVNLDAAVSDAAGAGTPEEGDASADIAAVVQQLSNSFERERLGLAMTRAEIALTPEKLAEAQQLLRECKHRMFFHALRKCDEEVVDGVVALTLGTAPEMAQARRLLNRTTWQFTYSHIKQLFSDKEGMACSADKGRTCMTALLRHLVHGTPIAFDYSGEYTFHLPAAVLKTQERLLAFQRALLSLQMGNPKDYFAAYLTEARAAEDWCREQLAASGVQEEQMGT